MFSLFSASVVEIVYKDVELALSESPINITMEDLEAVKAEWVELTSREKLNAYHTFFKLNKESKAHQRVADVKKSSREAIHLTAQVLKRYMTQFPNAGGYVDDVDKDHETASDKAFIASPKKKKKNIAPPKKKKNLNPKEKKQKNMTKKIMRFDDEKEDGDNQDDEEEEEADDDDDDDHHHHHHHHNEKKKTHRQNLTKKQTMKHTLADNVARSQMYFDSIKNSSDESKISEAKKK